MGANLVTLEEYKVYAGITSDKENQKLEAIIVSISQMVKTYCANSFVDYYGSGQEKVESFTIHWDTKTIQLTENPVVTIASVEERATYSSAYTALTTGAYEYYLDEDTDTLYRTDANGFKNWAKGPGSVVVTYSAGYSELPEDLKLAVFDLITYYYKEEYKERRTLGSSSVVNQTTSTQWRNVGFPDHIKRVLDLYKHIQL